MTDSLTPIDPHHLSSFTQFVSRHAPDLIARGSHAPTSELPSADTPHGTTIVAVSFDGGVLIAGDRRATMGNVIANRDMQKVFITDEFSAAGIAGAAGIAVELVRLFTVELEHYEKIEGVPLSFNAKANRLAALVRGNFSSALQGLAAVPLFVGFDVDDPDPQNAGRIVSYDITGGRYEERTGYFAVGSGAVYAKSSLKKLYRPSIDRDGAISMAIEALYDAADDDSATGGPDGTRRIYPLAIAITGDGADFVPEIDIASAATALADRRTESYREFEPQRFDQGDHQEGNNS